MHPTDVTWNEVERLADRLAASLPAVAGHSSGSFNGFDRVVGVARGGLVPAVLLAARLEINTVESVQVRLYEGNRRLDRPTLFGACPGPGGPEGDPAGTLVVDEIVDSGRTAAFLRARFPAACFCALLGRHAGEVERTAGGLIALHTQADPASKPVWVAADVATDAWVVFPWSPPEDRVEGA